MGKIRLWKPEMRAEQPVQNNNIYAQDIHETRPWLLLHCKGIIIAKAASSRIENAGR
jgi:hypothetical protein